MMLSAADSHSGLFFHVELPQPALRKNAREPTPLVPLLEIVSAAVSSPLLPRARLPRLAIAADSSTPSGLIDMHAIYRSVGTHFTPTSSAAFVAHRLVASTPQPKPKPSRAPALLIAAIMLLSLLAGALGYLALAIASSA